MYKISNNFAAIFNCVLGSGVAAVVDCVLGTAC